ncbi:hypothetical protein ACP70R_002937 [Stipagrostis hirtigluma subsp. patula]
MASTAAIQLVPTAAAGAAALTAPACPSTASRPCHGGRRRRRRALSCRASADDSSRLLWLPRRDVLAGLTGAAAGLAASSYPDLAAAAPQAVLEESCRRGDKVSDKLLECTDNGLPCPPSTRGVPVVDFKPPGGGAKRVRRPVHLLDDEYKKKYKDAVARMKALPASHPLSFTSQAAIHEAYCDGHYRFDPTEKNRPFDVHFSWIFAPWHRMYIYFYERALGHLVGDDNFALPYWNWDAPEGMALHAIFKDKESPLYDANRNQANLDALMDLDYITTRSKPIPFDNKQAPGYDELVKRNLSTIYQQQIRGGKGARCFLGDKLCTETSRRIKEINERSKLRRSPGTQLKRGNTSGSLERMAHSAVHVWAGRSKADPGVCPVGHDGKEHCANDMGFLGSAGRDPAFYSHHSNVDRMWHLWATKLGGRNFDDPEWLDTSFVFYDFAGDGKDDTATRLVRIKIRDVLDTANLGYTYDEESEAALPWINSKPSPLVPAGGRPPSPSKAAAPVFPLALKPDQAVVVPAVAKPAKEAGKLQVLVVDGIEFDPTIGAKFDVAINLPKDLAAKVGPQYSEYAGSFVSVASSGDGGSTLEGKVTLVLDDVLADIGAGGDDAVDVVIVPRSGDIKINLPPRIQNDAFC